MNAQQSEQITYSYGQRHDLTERPEVSGNDMWQVHYYTHADHRVTWDVSRGRVYASYAETYRMGRRHFGWQWERDVQERLPITL